MTENDPGPRALGCPIQSIGAGLFALSSVGIVFGIVSTRFDVSGLCLIAAAVVFAGIAIAEAILRRP